MNESIKFIEDSPVGKYEKNDTGVMLAVCREYTDKLVAVVRLTDDSYVTAPLSHIEHAGE